jgi:hypothetical protein
VGAASLRNLAEALAAINRHSERGSSRIWLQEDAIGHTCQLNRRKKMSS